MEIITTSEIRIKNSISSFGEILSFVDYFDKIALKCKLLCRAHHRLVRLENACLNPIPRQLKEVTMRTNKDLEKLVRYLPHQVERLSYFNLRYLASDETLEQILTCPALA